MTKFMMNKDSFEPTWISTSVWYQLPPYTQSTLVTSSLQLFLSFPFPRFFFFRTPVFNTTFTAEPIIHLVIEGNSRKVIKPVIVASIPYAGRCIYCIDCLRLWVFNYSFSLLTRIIAANCFKAKEKTQLVNTTSTYCCLHHFSEVLLIASFSKYGTYHWLLFFTESQLTKFSFIFRKRLLCIF